MTGKNSSFDNIIAWYDGILSHHKDIQFAPKISPRKLRKALKAYGPPGLNAEGVFVLIDNTLLRSAKDGLMITRDSLLARSGIGGVLNLRFDAIESVTVCKKSHIGVPIFGLEINEEHFAALPGLALPADGYDDVLLAPLAAMLLELAKKAKD